MADEGYPGCSYGETGSSPQALKSTIVEGTENLL